jgi:hypothetical protein
MNSFTTEELLQYLYNEIDATKMAAIQKALGSDWQLQERVQLLKKTQQQLDTLHYAPRTQTIDSILAYAERAEAEMTQPA